MDANKDGAGRARGQTPPWSRTDELNWAADRAVLRGLKKRGEEPSEWLATEYRELSARRKALTTEEAPRG